MTNKVEQPFFNEEDAADTVAHLLENLRNGKQTDSGEMGTIQVQTQEIRPVVPSSLLETEVSTEGSERGSGRILGKLKSKLGEVGSFLLNSLRPNYAMIPFGAAGAIVGWGIGVISQNSSPAFPITGAMVGTFLGGIWGELERRYTIKQDQTKPL